MGENEIKMLLSLIMLLCMVGFVLTLLFGQYLVAALLFIGWRGVLMLRKTYDE